MKISPLLWLKSSLNKARFAEADPSDERLRKSYVELVQAVTMFIEKSEKYDIGRVNFQLKDGKHVIPLNLEIDHKWQKLLGRTGTLVFYREVDANKCTCFETSFSRCEECDDQ